MAEQLPLKQFVEGSSPPGVTKTKGLIHKIIVYQTLGFLIIHLCLKFRFESQAAARKIVISYGRLITARQGKEKR